MEAQTTTDDATLEPRTGRRTRRHLARFAVMAAVAVASIAGSLVTTAGTADAATYRNQWVLYDGNRTDYDNEFAVYYDAYGRATQAWADVNNNGRWDSWTSLVNGQAHGWLFDLNEAGGWDALVTSNGTTYSNIGGCGTGPTSSLIGGGYYSSGVTVRYNDTVYGLSWCTMSSSLTGRISAPNLTGNWLYTLSTLSTLAPSMHCYNYAPYYSPTTRQCHSYPRA